ncbi:MAG: cob(I)yrinic acid a,c-diamide adenosyltransferase [Candidatus Omnitrophica bacterium]|nr:cob(I)yrinic acid a,c-diamide adenosyltransferase [Candidatus Omnitrophota bacterium]
MPSKKGKRSPQGLTICYTGNGKGKTTAALGLGLRALGGGKRVLIVQFMKNAPYGEHAILKKIPRLTLKIFGKGFCKIKGDCFPLAVHKKAACEAIAFTCRALKTKKYDMIICDEINCAYLCKLITLKDIQKLLRAKPSTVHLVCTGRGAPRLLMKHAHLVSEVREIKHPFRKGFPAQEGIEF